MILIKRTDKKPLTFGHVETTCNELYFDSNRKWKGSDIEKAFKIVQNDNDEFAKGFNHIANETSRGFADAQADIDLLAEEHNDHERRIHDIEKRASTDRKVTALGFLILGLCIASLERRVTNLEKNWRRICSLHEDIRRQSRERREENKDEI